MIRQLLNERTNCTSKLLFLLLLLFLSRIKNTSFFVIFLFLNFRFIFYFMEFGIWHSTLFFYWAKILFADFVVVVYRLYGIVFVHRSMHFLCIKHHTLPKINNRYLSCISAHCNISIENVINKLFSVCNYRVETSKHIRTENAHAHTILWFSTPKWEIT